MDNSDDAFRAVEKTIDIVKDRLSKDNKTKSNTTDTTIRNNGLPEIIAFHSTEHHNLAEKIALYIPSSFGSNYSIPPTDYRKLQEEYRIHGKKILEKTENIFEKNNIEIETRLITDEKPEDYIEKVVQEEKVDLIVLGSKGEHSKLEQLFSGTIAQKVVNDVPCDVLIVR